MGRLQSCARNLKMSKLKKKSENINITKNCVFREICDANIYYNLLFIWINRIKLNKIFYKDFKGIFNYIEEAFITKYIFALTKIFARSSEEGLWKLLLQAKEVPENLFELRLERDPTFIHKQIRQQREEFFRNINSYIAKIQEIKAKLVALRNKQRAHNFPFMPDGQKVIWTETKEWLTFAENTFFYAMTAVCEGSCSPGHFIPEELNVEMKHSASIIKDINLTNPGDVS